MYTKLQTPNKTDIKEMLELNKKIYPEEWHVSVDYVEQIMDINPEAYRVLKKDGEVKGIYSLFPLERSIYEKVLEGTFDEKWLNDYVLDYSQPKEVYLYLISIIVDIHDEDRKQYTKSLLKDMPSQLKSLSEKGIDIKEVGAFAISNDGDRILKRIGFDLDTHIKSEYPVYRATPDKVIDAIRL